MTEDGAKPPGSSSDFAEALGHLGPRLLGALAGLEAARRQLHPPTFEPVRARLAPLGDALAAAWQAFDALEVPDGLGGLVGELSTATEHALAAVEGLAGGVGGAPDAVPRALAAMHRHHRAEAALFGLRRVLPPINTFFLEPACRARVDELDPPEPGFPDLVGLHRAPGDPQGRGGFLLYVPESYDGSPWPLVCALHGGSGHGEDFLWTWLREARSRRFVLLSPTSRGSTWSLHAPEIDVASLHAMVDSVCERVAIDRDRTLLTGLSDGATFTLLAGHAEVSPFRALAPVSGVLHPMLLADPAARERLVGRRIHLVHGALDWMFPVDLARAAAERMREAGADLEYLEIEDLSHTYPREANASILEWFDPSLALGEAAQQRP